MADDAWLISRCAPAVDRNVGETAQLTDEVFDVRASTSIDLRRIFTRQHGDSRRCHHRQFGIRSGAPSGHVGEGEGDGDVGTAEARSTPRLPPTAPGPTWQAGNHT